MMQVPAPENETSFIDVPLKPGLNRKLILNLSVCSSEAKGGEVRGQRSPEEEKRQGWGVSGIKGV